MKDKRSNHWGKACVDDSKSFILFTTFKWDSKYFELFCLCKRQVHSLDSAKNLVLPQKYYIRKCYLKSINNIKYIRRRIFDGIS